LQAKDIKMAERIGNFVVFLVLTLITLGIYPLYFYVTRTQENIELLTEIRDELIEQRNNKSKE
jgi:NADH:ubiquinone oxidoreductase subunit 4 (subunit M)